MVTLPRFLLSKADRAKQNISDLRRDRFWAFSKEWDDEIDKAIAANDGDRLTQLYEALKLASDEHPLEFPLLFIVDVPREIEELFAKQATKSDHVALHNSLRAMSSGEQEKVVKALIKFWFKRDCDAVPNDLRDWAIPKPDVNRDISTVIAEIIPHGAIADIPNSQPIAILPQFTINTLEPEDKVRHVLLTWQNVRLVGMRGSGKTSKARWICQHRAKQGEKIYWVNPHLSYEDKILLQSLGVIIIGGGRDYEAIARFCSEYCEGENSVLNKEYGRYNSEANAVFNAETIVLDELTNYKEQVGAPILTFVKASIQEFSKINRSVIYITHNTTLSCMGAPEGFSQAIKDNLFDLKLEADPMQGNRVPKAIAKYRMPSSDEWQDVKIPVEWQ